MEEVRELDNNLEDKAGSEQKPKAKQTIIIAISGVNEWGSSQHGW